MNDLTTTPRERSPGPLDRFAPVGWLRGEIDRLFEGFGRPPRGLFEDSWSGTAPQVALEMTETDDAYQVTAEVPGLAEADVEVSVGDGLLAISGTKKDERKQNENGMLVTERRYGSFMRQVRLPDDVLLDGIAAKVERGVLHVTLPKDGDSRAARRKIEIKMA